ncbi:MAG TPA: histidine phosphatase family protein [Rhodanobacteraceae bacterium]|nr:histidine phosphatase family protein [Rhodanobacteraceae bacterium]
MRELILLRHAEAMQIALGSSDRARPLSLRGEAEARDAGAWLHAQGAAFDAVLCSPARRAQMTVERVLDVFGAQAPAPRFLGEIYEATPGTLIALLEQHATLAQSVLLVGHNPGMEQLLAFLTQGRSDRARGMPPAGLAWIELGEAGFEPGSARLRAFWSP